MSRLLRLKDTFRHSHTARSLAGLLSWIKASTQSNPVQHATSLSRALDFSSWPLLRQGISAALNKKHGLENEELWTAVLRSNPRYQKVMQADPRLTRSVLLKAPSANGEKGILLMTFEYNWARLMAGLSQTEFRWLDDHYDLVLSTSWSPTDYAALACAVSRVRGKVFVQSCNFQEIPDIEAFHPRLRCLPTLPCDWINPRLYHPLPFKERSTDIVMVANWGEFKRHWDLFRALSQMPEDLKIVLIGQREGGRTQDTIRSLARSFGAKQNLEIHESIPIAEVAAHQCQAKISVIMSRREGCCVAAVESLFAGCALAMRNDAHVGPLAYINPQTGRRLRPAFMAQDLMRLLDEAADMQPHSWAAQNLSCQVSHQRVNSMLKEESLQAGKPWTRDIIQPQWRPHPTYASEDSKEAVRPAYEVLQGRFPQIFPATLLDESWR